MYIFLKLSPIVPLENLSRSKSHLNLHPKRYHFGLMETYEWQEAYPNNSSGEYYKKLGGKKINAGLSPERSRGSSTRGAKAHVGCPKLSCGLLSTELIGEHCGLWSLGRPSKVKDGRDNSATNGEREKASLVYILRVSYSSGFTKLDGTGCDGFEDSEWGFERGRAARRFEGAKSISSV
ncbi:uncharacterized protein MELLADRAFT_106321 [Melampsora larici-populina 98AG31]|uniref:Uncharacterized protein n=1 Tax=Melampsora larici-populina (strain 98AG31 / pathotype 3-4-7) TaxID=747676 RepID=F4RL01_MELLP|nr:uncharacterized protein MELLADRAFT_106321 [Melampsora larici-populina 98AG31]EGG06814.1 hypothetical protein MELLADRAFT_106321 [Melampsora larici-populina 98AG31]